MTGLPTANPAPSRARRFRRWGWLAMTAIGAAIVVAAAAGYAWLQTPAALAWAVERIHSQSLGRLAIVDASGSLLSTIHARELRYQDDGVELVAHEVLFTWSPRALLSQTIRISGLDARHVAVTLQPPGPKGALPGSLALPFEIVIDKAAFGEIAVVTSSRSYRVSGVRFGYAGGASAHRWREIALASEWGSIAGELSIAAATPFAVSGTATIAGSERLRGARLQLALAGTLERLQLKASGSAIGTGIDGSATVTPYGEVPLQELALEARELDLAAVDPSLPHTTIAVTIAATLATDGSVMGTLAAANGSAGPIDRDQLPVDSFNTGFVLSADALALTGFVATSGPAARATGDARIPLGDTAMRSQWQFDLARLDLARIHSKLAPTRLSGRLRATLSGTEQQLDGDLSQDDLGASFAATVTGSRVNVTRLRARAGRGEFNGSGRYEFSGTERFEVVGRAQHFEPARFTAFPPAVLDGELRASGALRPAWHADVAIVLAPGSRLRGAPLAGELRARVTATTLEEAVINLRLAGAAVKAHGGFGHPAARIDATFDVPEIASVLGPLGDWIPVAARELRGRLVGTASASGVAGLREGTIDVRGEGLTLGAISTGTVEFHGALAGAKADPRVTVSVAGTRLATPTGNYPTWSAKLAGTAGAHRLQAALAGEGFAADLTAEGAWANGRWDGAVTHFANRGSLAAKLERSAHLTVGEGRVVVGDAQLAIADGNVRLEGFRWEDGVMTSSGTFHAVPLLALARLAGTELPVRSTLIVGGEWNVAATPRLNGTLTVRREQGDVFARSTAARDGGEIAFGLSRTDLRVVLVDDAVDATLEIDAARLASARGKLSLGRDPNAAAGRLGGGAPVQGSLTATLSSLDALQPLIGTAARIEGQVKLDLRAEGSLRQMAIVGTVAGDKLRLAAPTYGLNWTDGVLRARIGGGTLALDAFSFAAGDGRFTATGTVAPAPASDAAGAPAGAGTDIAWRADKLRVTNRPDLRLIVSGAGRLGFTGGHLQVTGAVKIDEGQVEFDRARGATLGDDVIVVGREPRPAAGASRFGRMPLGLDLEVDLGRDLAVSAEGLQTHATGKVRISAVPNATLSAKGTISAVNGTYFAFGQRLTIRRGVLIFDGPIDNPALDIVALRQHLPVEAGVSVSGTVRVPRVELTSEPPVPDGEKLSWLVLGQGLDRTTTADTAALQAAATTIFGRNRMPVGASIAQAIGLDDIGIRGSRTAGDPGSSGAAGQVVSVGKRLSDRLYVVFEQGLTVANNALKIEYALTRSITLRAEAGLISGVGIHYRRSFE